mmetsp:Transcript_42318/g.79256  ORF Transcript_42318/g.79256 Transcript_42318/m.79256 type:complete len:544 (+) Transcript_42318:95-1726(+)
MVRRGPSAALLAPCSSHKDICNASRRTMIQRSVVAMHRRATARGAAGTRFQTYPPASKLLAALCLLVSIRGVHGHAGAAAIPVPAPAPAAAGAPGVGPSPGLPGLFSASGLYSHHGTEWRMGSCISRERQSPVNFDDHLEDPPEGFLDYHYQLIRNKELKIEAKNGLVFIDMSSGDPVGGVVFNQEMYSLMRIDFHSPAEHLIKGQRHPLEIHLVHRKRTDPERNLIIAVLVWSQYKPEVAPVGVKPVPLKETEYEVPSYKEVDFNPYLQHFLTRSLPDAEGGRSRLVIPQDNPLDLGTLVVNDAIQDSGTYIQYTGSLTSPPCTDKTTWFVRRNPMIASDSQVKAFAHSILKLTNYQGNFRAVMPVNGRALATVAARWSPIAGSFIRPALPLGPNPRTDGELEAKMATEQAEDVSKQSMEYMHNFAERLKKSSWKGLRHFKEIRVRQSSVPEDKKMSFRWKDVVRRTQEGIRSILRDCQSHVDKTVREEEKHVHLRAAEEARVATKMLLNYDPPSPGEEGREEMFDEIRGMVVGAGKAGDFR